MATVRTVRLPASGGTVPAALLYAALFVPEFIEIEGFVFLKELGVRPSGGVEAVAQQLRHIRATSPQALQSYVESCNWVEIAYLFASSEVAESEDAILADLVVDAWRARLADQFPGRRFAVRVISPDESGSVTSVGFTETRS